MDIFPDLKKESSLRGTTKKTNTSSIPASKIPDQYHVKQISGTPSTDPDYKTEYDEKSKQWKTTIFPSLKPGGRQEVLLLDKWLNDMLAENLAKNLDPIDSVKEAQELYSTCFHEICRQVHVQCAERGKLMEKIWNRYLQLFDHILKIREREKFSQTQKIEQQKTVYQKLYKEKDDKFNKAYLQLAADKEKITMSKDKLERAVLVLQEEYKKRVKQEQVMKKHIKKMQGQLSRHHLASSMSQSSDSFEETKEEGKGAEEAKGNEEEPTEGKKKVRIKGDDSSSDASRRDSDYFNRASSMLSLQSADSFARYEEEEEEETEVQEILFNAEDIDFSNSNLILVNKLEFITSGLRSIHKLLSARGDLDDAYALTQQLGSVLEAIIDVVNRMEHPENVQEPKVPLQFKALSTLSALRAPVDKAVQTMELEVSEAIPKAYASYFAKSFRVPVVHTKDKRYVLACISYIYTQKIADDEEFKSKNVVRPSLPQHLYELFLRVFGMRSWAEMHLLDFLASLRKFMQQHLRIKMFARFAHIGEEILSPYSNDDLHFYLYVLGQFRPHQGKLPSDTSAPIIRESKDGNRTISIKAAIAVIHAVFPDIEAPAKESLIRVVESCSQVDEMDGITQVVDMDKYLEVLLEEYHLRCNILSKKFQRTLEDNVSAPLPENLLLYDEFMMCMSHFQTGVPESQVMAMYREILESSSSLNSVELKIVLQVVRNHGFFCWKSFYSKIEKSTTDYYLLQFLEFIWETTKLDLNDKLKKIHLDSAVLPKVSSQLQERVKYFQTAMANSSARAALSCYRQLVVQIFFASKKQNRLTSGEHIRVVEREDEDETTPENSPPSSP